MSVSSAQSFLRKVASDPDFKIVVLAMLGTGEAIRNFIRSQGFDFTYEELQKGARAIRSTLLYSGVDPGDIDKITERY